MRPGVFRQERGHSCHRDWECRHLFADQRAGDCDSRDVVPVGTRLVVDEQCQAVVEPARRKVVDLAVDLGRQTDAAVTDRSERDEVG